MRAALLILLSPALTAQSAVQPDLRLHGTVGPADKGTYQEHTFNVPPGTTRIDFRFTHSHKDVGAQLEVGVFDPQRFRGTSRFSKTAFFIADGHATPSYFPGPLPAGRWRVSLGIPALGSATRVDWSVDIVLSSAADTRQPAAGAPAEPRWWRGDFHAHTLHSDGFGCINPENPTVTRGCHTWEIVEAARSLNLDFVAITDHNTTSHHAEMAALQETTPNLLLVRGQELTTFHGHANVYGTSAFVDFRLGFQGRTIVDVANEVTRVGGLLSINHPGRETGDRCTGCGWDAPGTPWDRVEVLEVVNGTTLEGPTAGLWFWQARLNEGHRISGIGGSDDHAVRSNRSRLGTPTTMVFASALTESALLEGVRSGRVYIRTRGPEGPSIDLAVAGPDGSVPMGSTLRVSGPLGVSLQIETVGAAGQHAEVVFNGAVVATPVVSAGLAPLTIPLSVKPGDWLNVRLRDADGITAISNPIYIR
jgi:hypothetical protein